MDNAYLDHVCDIDVFCDLVRYNSMNVILGLCHSYSGKVVTFQESREVEHVKRGHLRPPGPSPETSRDRTGPERA